jgi:hypothetical protein
MSNSHIKIPPFALLFAKEDNKYAEMKEPGFYAGPFRNADLILLCYLNLRALLNVACILIFAFSITSIILNLNFMPLLGFSITS